jgi:hypothetical protein
MTERMLIEVSEIAAVQIGEQWHQVVDESFTVATAEYSRDGRVILPGGRNNPPAFFAFTEWADRQRTTITGPVGSIVAVRLRGQEP